MRKVACRYAVVQFTPYTETGEFANIGVVLVCPQTGYFDFLLQTRKSKRVTDFFDELPRDVYLRAVQGIRTELLRLSDVVREASDPTRVDFVRGLFERLVHPREAIIRFSAPRVLIADDPAAELRKQFDHYVDRAFATPEYVEHTIEKRIKNLLQALELKRPFRAMRVGDDEVHVNFSLVQMQGDHAVKVIKPFNLGQTEPMGIYDHGDTWVQRLRRLRKRRLLPRDVLFVVRPPAEPDASRRKAFDEVCDDLRAIDVTTVDERDDSSIARFAQA